MKIIDVLILYFIYTLINIFYNFCSTENEQFWQNVLLLPINYRFFYFARISISVGPIQRFGPNTKKRDKLASKSVCQFFYFLRACTSSFLNTSILIKLTRNYLKIRSNFVKNVYLQLWLTCLTSRQNNALYI